MLAVRTILHPTDFSERSQDALWLACALARDYGARLVVLHIAGMPALVYEEGVVAPGPAELRAAAQEQLDRLQVPQGNVPTERRLEQGDIVTGVLRVAQEAHANLIVMG